MSILKLLPRLIKQLIDLIKKKINKNKNKKLPGEDQSGKSVDISIIIPSNVENVNEIDKINNSGAFDKVKKDISKTHDYVELRSDCIVISKTVDDMSKFVNSQSFDNKYTDTYIKFNRDLRDTLVETYNSLKEVFNDIDKNNEEIAKQLDELNKAEADSNFTERIKTTNKDIDKTSNDLDDLLDSI